MTLVLIIAAGVIIVALLSLLLLTVKTSARREATEALGGASNIRLLDAMALMRAVESKGLFQVSGNGCLGLNSDEVVFVMWMPRRTLRLPRSLIVSVETRASFMGKWSGRPMLRILWKSEEGATDSAVWIVRDLDAWVRELKS